MNIDKDERIEIPIGGYRFVVNAKSPSVKETGALTWDAR